MIIRIILLSDIDKQRRRWANKKNYRNIDLEGSRSKRIKGQRRRRCIIAAARKVLYEKEKENKQIIQCCRDIITRARCRHGSHGGHGAPSTAAETQKSRISRGGDAKCTQQMALLA